MVRCWETDFGAGIGPAMAYAPPMAALDHALVGNGRMLALIAPGGDAEWASLSRFDAHPFCAALTAVDGGSFAVAPVGAIVSRQVAYHPSSNAVRSSLAFEGGRLAIDDIALPVPASGTAPAAEWIRIVRPLEGPVTVRVIFTPRMGGAVPRLTADGIEVGSLALRIGPVEVGVTAAAVLRGEPVTIDRPLVLVLADGLPETPATLAAAEAVLDDALATGRARIDRLPLALPPIAHRAYSCLTQHVYAATGAIIAGVIASDPADRPRRLWLREATEAADTLLSLGSFDPARRLLTLLRQMSGGAPLRADYAIEPLRPSNADTPAAPAERAGRVLHLAHRIHTVSGARPNRMSYEWLAGLVEQVAEQRGRPDCGPWDGPAGAYTVSHLWSWAAFDRGARVARLVGEAPRAERWAALAESEAALIRHAMDDVGLLASTLHGRRLDPAVCIARRLGFVDEGTPAWLRTLDGLAASAVDGLVPSPLGSWPLGARPLAATFWTAEALARAGWGERARALFEAAARYANPAGLFAEAVGVDGQPEGRFPSVAVHVAALRAAMAMR